MTPGRRALTLPRCPHRAVAGRGIGIHQLEIDLTLRQIDPVQAHPHRIAQLPAPAGSLSHQAHAAVLELPVVAGYRRNMHQTVNGHVLQLHKQAKFERARNRRVEGFADPRLHVQALEISHDIPRRIVGAALALRTLHSQNLQLAAL